MGMKIPADLEAEILRRADHVGPCAQIAQDEPETPKARQCPKDKAKATTITPVVWKAFDVPQPTPEFRFCERRWRLDYAWVDEKVALEIEGGVWDWAPGRHNRRKGFQGDLEKYNRLAVLGWRLLRCTPQDVKDGSIFALIRKALKLEDLNHGQN